jgi:hypothetical protein
LCFTTRGEAFAISLQATQPAPEVANPQPQDRVSQLEARIRSLEDRYQQAGGFRDADYILRIQKQYETYYEKAFDTQRNTIWAVGIIFTVILAVGGRFSLSMFEKRFEYAIRVARDELERSFEEKLARKTAELDKANQGNLAKTIEGVKEQTNRLVGDVKQSLDFSTQFIQGLTFAHADRYNQAKLHYGRAVAIYLENGAGKVNKEDCAVALSNLFRDIFAEDKNKFEENVKTELQKKQYSELQEELALAAVEFPRLAPILNQIAQQK